MAPRSLDFQCALVTGGGGGIGKAMSEYLISQGKKVIICGRTESNLQSSSKELGATAYYVLDTGKIDAIPAFVEKITKEHPELDCIINNAGVQRPLQVDQMDASEFLEKADIEININIRGPMHLAVALLPHFKTKKSAVIMNVSSVLGYVPTSIINPVYNGTKAWVHMWSMNLRTQLAQGGHNIKVVEIVPPQVATELHREREDPHDNAGGMSVDQFVKEVSQGWDEDKDTVGAGLGREMLEKWYDAFGEPYSKASGGK